MTSRPHLAKNFNRCRHLLLANLLIFLFLRRSLQPTNGTRVFRHN